MNKDLLNNKAANFKQIICLLFNNYGFDTYSNFLKFKDELFDACTRENVNLVDLLAKKKVEVNRLLFNLDLKEKTAGLMRCNSPDKYLQIPRSITYQSNEF